MNQALNLDQTTIFEQTGWQRPFPQVLCQDLDVLKEVTHYTFDLTDPVFKAYCKARNIFHKAGLDERYEFTANIHATEAEFKSNELFQFAPWNRGSRYRYTPEQLHSHWQIMRAAKGSIQDCWEIYIATEANH